MEKKHPLYNMVYPDSLVVAGASNDLRNMGTIQALNILNNGYKGDVCFLHPKEKEVLGRKTYSDPSELPRNIGLAVLIVPTRVVPGMLEGLGKKGVKNIIITTAGFQEMGADGKALQQQIVEISKKYKIRFIGPNCIGIINTDNMLNTTFLPYVGKRGHVGLASQSGTYVTQTSYYLAEHEVHFSKAFSLGNEANIDIVDAIEFLENDPQTKSIALYIEGIRRGREFIEVCRRVSKKKPIVALYVGGSTAGARAGMSHTGAMAGPDDFYESVFKQAGVIRARTVDDLYFWTQAMVKQQPPKGKRIAVLTNSGGPGSSIADSLEKAGMEVPRFSDKLQKKLEKKLPSTGSAQNPVDLTFYRDYRVMTYDFPKILFDSGEIDGLIVHGTLGSSFQRAMYHNMKTITKLPFEEFTRFLKAEITPLYELNRKYKMPVILSNFFGSEDNLVTKARQLGLPSLRRPEAAAETMKALFDFGRMKKLPPFQFDKLKPKVHPLVKEAVKRGDTMLDEINAKRLLAFYGVPVVPEEICTNLQNATDIAKKLKFPVVLKAVGEGIMHKTELGLIVTGIKDTKALEKHYKIINKKICDNKAAKIAIARQVEGDRELIIGATRFPQFGPAVMFGLGGVFTEVLRDFTFRVAPFNEKEAERMVDEIRGAKILSAFRGKKVASRKQLAGLLVSVGKLMAENPAIAELDINPVILSKQGRPVAVDALIKLDSN